MERLGKFKEKMKDLKLNFKSRILLLTHNDLDGSGPAVLLKALFKNVFITHCANSTMDQHIKESITDKSICNKYDIIFVTDISCTEETAKLINKDPDIRKLILLDHHKTAYHLNKYEWAFVEEMALSGNKRTSFYPSDAAAHSSGTSLMYDFLDYYDILSSRAFNYELAKELTFVISSYDTWDWVNIFKKDEKFHDLNTLFWLYQMKLFDEIFSQKLLDWEATLFDKNDQLVLTIEKNRINSVVENKIKSAVKATAELNGKTYSVVYVSASQFNSDIFEKMKEEFSDCQIAMINTGTTISLRSIDKNVDVSEIAKAYGGGGHPLASGIPISFDKQKAVFENVFSASFTPIV